MLHMPIIPAKHDRHSEFITERFSSIHVFSDPQAAGIFAGPLVLLPPSAAHLLRN
jgi:hypothetical protein